MEIGSVLIPHITNYNVLYKNNSCKTVKLSRSGLVALASLLIVYPPTRNQKSADIIPFRCDLISGWKDDILLEQSPFALWMALAPLFVVTIHPLENNVIL